MKTVLNKLYALSLLSLVLFACEKDEDRLVIQPGTAPVLNASETAIALDKDNAEEEAVVFTWTPAEYGYPAAVNYVLEVDQQGNNFADAVTTDMGSGSSFTFTVQEFNQLLNEMEVTPGAAEDFEFRIRAEVSPQVPPLMSNAVAINATPYLDVAFSTIYMVGDATQYGWTNAPGQVTPMFPHPTLPNTYTFTGRFNAGMLKFVQFPGQWAPQWGQSGPGELAFRPTEDVADPAPIDVPAAGYYTVTVDLANLTYTLEPFNATTVPTYASIGIIGGFNDWSEIVPMVKNDFNPHLWSLEHTFTAPTEMKFRIASGWDVNWGPSSNVDRLFGMGVQNGQNMVVNPGTYLIVFNDITGNYMLMPR